MTKIVQIEPQDNFSLFVKLSNGKEGIFDVSPYLNKGVFTELSNLHYFRKARIAFGGVAWPNNQDFSADTVEFELKM